MGDDMTDQEQKKQLQIDAGIPHLPTDLTYQCRIAIAGEGERGWEWQDKPHRLVYDLCRQVEADADRIEELIEENKELTLQLLAVHGQAADALDKAVVAEAKLAKAVEALRVALEGLNWAKAYLSTSGIDSVPVNYADAKVYAVLAELEVKE